MNATTFAVMQPIRVTDYLKPPTEPDSQVPYSRLTIPWEPAHLEEWCRILGVAAEMSIPVEKLLEMARKAYQDGVDHGVLTRRSW